MADQVSVSKQAIILTTGNSMNAPKQVADNGHSFILNLKINKNAIVFEQEAKQLKIFFTTGVLDATFVQKSMVWLISNFWKMSMSNLYTTKSPQKQSPILQVPNFN